MSGERFERGKRREGFANVSQHSVTEMLLDAKLQYGRMKWRYEHIHAAHVTVTYRQQGGRFLRIRVEFLKG